MPNEFNKHDKQDYARYYPRRMSAEVLFDAVSQVTDSPATFAGLPQRQARAEAGDHAAGRVVPVVLPRRVRPAAAHQRLRMRARQRGQPGPGAAPAELARRSRASWRRAGGRADMLAKDPRPDAEKVEELFLWAFARKPTPEQLQLALAHIAKHDAEQEGGLREHPLGAAQHQGVHVQPLTSSKPGEPAA